MPFSCDERILRDAAEIRAKEAAVAIKGIKINMKSKGFAIKESNLGATGIMKPGISPRIKNIYGRPFVISLLNVVVVLCTVTIYLKIPNTVAIEARPTVSNFIN